MKNLIYPFLLLLLFLSAFFSRLFPQTAIKKELHLEFEKTDKAQRCFIPHRQLRRPNIGLALSGGGARGFAQIGVLQVLEENDIPIDFIVGTSIGSIIGGLYAAGYSAHQIDAITQDIDWGNIMVDKPPRTNMFVAQKDESGRTILQLRFDGTKLSLPQAITPGQKLTSILTSLILRANFQVSTDFDQLKIPFRALTCDLVTGDKVLLKDGNLAEAMRSSAAVPLLFEPVPKNDMMLVDGGLMNNLPVDEVRELGAEMVIALDTSSELNEKSRLKIPWIVADQVTSIMQSEKKENQRKSADVLITPELSEFKSDDFELVKQLIQIGREATLAQIAHIKNVLQAHQIINLSHKLFPVKSLFISASDSRLKLIAQHEINKFISSTASDSSIYESMQAIYKTGYFSNVSSAYVCDYNDSLAIDFHLTENPSFSQIQFEGNIVFPDSLLRSKISSRAGFPINCFQAAEDISKIIRLYKEQGYALINIENIFLANDSLTIQLNEGIISSITTEGNRKTKNYVILREFPLKPGKIFNINEADNGINNIYSTNLFKTVSYELIQNDQQVTVKIKVEEKAFNSMRFSYRYDLERQNKGMIELADENFFGLANTLTLHGQYGNRDKVLKFNFRSDRIFKTFLASALEINHQQHKHFVYSEGNKIGEYQHRENGFSLSLGRQIERLGILSIIAAAKEVNLHSVSGTGYPTGSYDMKTIELQSIVDTQDKFPFATSGKYYLFSYKLSSSTFLNSQTSFFKLFSSFEFYTTFLRRNTIHPKFFWGTSDLTTPFIEQFRLGGQNSFLGLQENESIGRHIAVACLQYRYEFPFGFPVNVYWSLKYNIGNTWKNSVNINPKDFIHGLGTSLSMDTPVGPLSFSLGRLSEGRALFYFSAGFEF